MIWKKMRKHCELHPSIFKIKENVPLKESFKFKGVNSRGTKSQEG